MFFKDDNEPIISSKSNFYFGFVCGIAIISTLGLLIIGGLFMKNGLGVDFFSATDGQEDGAVADNSGSDDANAVKPSQPSPTNNDAGGAAGGKVDIKVASNDRIRGNKKAPITIVEFSDYQCPFCSKFHDTMKQVMQNYPDKVRWVYKHFPLESIHPIAKKAAEAAECAGDQNKFWEFSDEVFANQSSLSVGYLSTIAKKLGLNTGKFESCLSSGKYVKKVENDMSEGQKLGVRGTPGSFINGKSIPGAVPYSQIESMIKAELGK